MKRFLFLILIIPLIIADIFIVVSSADLSDGLDTDSHPIALTASASGYISGLDYIQVGENDISFTMELPSGWSIISLPVITYNTSVSSIFPEAKTVYGYEKGTGYVRISAIEDLEPGKGYWILLDQNQSYTLTGQPILSYNKTIYENRWEMIGGCSYSAKAFTDGCDIGVIYKYVQGEGYQSVPDPKDLEPGKGYWMLLRDFTCQAYSNINGLSRDAYFLGLLCELDYPVVMSRQEPSLQETITFIKKGHGEHEEVSRDQSIIKLFFELTLDQRTAYIEFNNNTKTDITQARNIEKNDNELLFPEERRHLYNSVEEGISPEHLLLFYGEDCPFKYTEYRKTKGGRTRISPSMILKSNREFTLKEGLYFFEELTLEKDSTLNTDGDVLIYVKKLELKQNAKLMGGTSTHPDKVKPNDLIILAQRWDGAYYDPEDGVKIGPAAKVYGHIFAPDLKVRLSRGSKGKETRVHGSILTYQLVTYIESGGQIDYGPIQIIYGEYLKRACELRLKTD